jgi:hypothetical protein
LDPIGIRNNNPGNIRPVAAYKWQGEIGANGGFCVFDTMENGIRALCKNLIAYYTRSPKIDTVREAISRWAPASENDTEAYVDHVATMLEVKPDDELNFKDPDTLFWLAVAIGEHENGHDAFTAAVTDAQLEAGVAAALS